MVHGRGFRKKITGDSVMMHTDSMQDTNKCGMMWKMHIDSMQDTNKRGMMWKKNLTENLIFDLRSSLSLFD